MLSNFCFARYHFTYTVQEPLKMPRYKGNIFLGLLGDTLRGITCSEVNGMRQSASVPKAVHLLQML